jgi:putative NADH-flavin reductase
MNILILGATGRAGRLLLTEALKRGHRVTVLVSHKSTLIINTPMMTVYEGTPLNRFTLSDAMKGCDAVLSTLNISRTSDFPWARLRTSKDFLSTTLRKVLEIATEQQINRIIITTAWGVGETRKDIPFWFRWLIDNSNIRYPYRDHELQEQIIKHFDINWTVVRPVGLTDARNRKEVVVSLDNDPKPKLTVSRQIVAKFMMDVVENNLYTKQFPVVFEK